MACDFTLSSTYSFGLLYVALPKQTITFFVLPKKGQLKRHTLRTLSCPSDADVLRKRLHVHGLQLNHFNISFDAFTTCVASRWFEFGAAVPFLSPPSRPVAEQYAGFIYDDILDADLNLIETIVGTDLIYFSTFIGHYFHPSICMIDDSKILLMSRGTQGVLKEIPVFHWIHLIKAQEASATPFMVKITDANIDFMKQSLIAREEPRCVRHTNESIHLTFTHPARMSFAQTEYAKLLWNSSMMMFQISPLVVMSYSEASNMSQKNWVPFLYNESIFFVYRIVPLIVIQLQPRHHERLRDNERLT